MPRSAARTAPPCPMVTLLPCGHRRRDGARRPGATVLAARHAERYEILIDFRKFKVGQTVDLRNLSNKNNIDFANTDKIMRFQVVADSGPASTITAIPTTLECGPQPNADLGGIATMELTPAMAVAKRQLRFERQSG